MICIFDREEALQRVGDCECLLAEILDLFTETCPQMLEAIHQSVAGGDADALERAAHSLKGAAGNIAARAVADRAGDVESAAAAGRLTDAMAGISLLERELDRLGPALAECCAEKS